MAVSGGFTLMMGRLQERIGIWILFIQMNYLFKDGKLDGVKINR